MVSVSEARQQLTAARSQVAQRQQEAEEQKRKVEEQKKKLPNVKSQQYLRGQKGLSGLQGREQRRSVLKTGNILGERQKDLEDYKQQLTAFEQNDLASFEQQINVAEQQQLQAEQYNLAVRVYLGLASGGSTDFKNIPQSIKTQAQTDAEAIERQQSYTWINENISSLEQQYPDMEFSPDLRNMQIKVKTPDGQVFKSIESYNKSLADLNRQEKATSKPLEPPTIEGFTSSVLQEGQNPLMVTEAPSRLSYLWSSVKQRGVINTATDFLGQKTGQLLSLNNPEKYNTQGIQNLGQLVGGTSLYFTPAGAALLIGSAGESVVFPSGRSEISSTSQKAQQTGISQVLINLGVPSIISKNVGYVQPIAEASLGVIGLKSQIRNAKINSLSPETNFVGTIERTGGKSQINILQKTSGLGDDVFSIGRGEVKPLGNNRFVSNFQGYNLAGDVSRGIKYPPTLVSVGKYPELLKTKFPEIQRVVEFNTGRTLGSGWAVREQGALKLRAELGRGFISDGTVLVYRNVGNNIYAYQGGRAVLRINKATGRVSEVVKQPNIKGQIVRVPSSAKPSNTNIFFNSGGKKTPLSVTFAQEKAEQEAVVSIVSSLEKSAKAKNKGVKPTPSTASGVASLEPQTLPKDELSIWVGKGKYERTEGGLLPSDKTQGALRDFEAIAPADFINVKGGLINDFADRTKNKDVDLLGIGNAPKPKEKTNLYTPQEAKLLAGIISKLGAKEISRQDVINFLKPARPRPTTTRPKPIIPIILPKKTTSSLQNKGKRKIYEAVIKRFGKDITIFKGESKGQAEQKLKGKLLTTLGRSGKIFEDGKEIELNFGRMFRPSRKDTKRIVQRAEFSLGTRGEVSEIQMFKKRKKNKTGFF